MQAGDTMRNSCSYRTFSHFTGADYLPWMVMPEDIPIFVIDIIRYCPLLRSVKITPAKAQQEPRRYDFDSSWTRPGKGIAILLSEKA